MLALVLAGCATTSDSVAREEAALAAELQGYGAGEPQSCIPVHTGQSLQIVSADTLVLRTGGVIWVNRLEADCPGLRPLNQLIVEPSLSGRYCRNDRIRSLEPGSTISGAICPLGNFTPYRRR
jgi:hypothetical protein